MPIDRIIWLSIKFNPQLLTYMYKCTESISGSKLKSKMRNDLICATKRRKNHNLHVPSLVVSVQSVRFSTLYHIVLWSKKRRKKNCYMNSVRILIHPNVMIFGHFISIQCYQFRTSIILDIYTLLKICMDVSNSLRTNWQPANEWLFGIIHLWAVTYTVRQVYMCVCTVFTVQTRSENVVDTLYRKRASKQTAYSKKLKGNTLWI